MRRWRPIDPEAAMMRKTRAFKLTAPRATENDIEAGCMTILGLHKYWVVKLHAGTFQTLDCARKLKGVKKGTPDYACMHERHRGFLLEVKRPGGVLSPDQVAEINTLHIQYRLPIAVVDSVEALSSFLARHERSP